MHWLKTEFLIILNILWLNLFLYLLKSSVNNNIPEMFKYTTFLHVNHRYEMWCVRQNPWTRICTFDLVYGDQYSSIVCHRMPCILFSLSSIATNISISNWLCRAQYGSIYYILRVKHAICITSKKLNLKHTFSIVIIAFMLIAVLRLLRATVDVY